MDAVDSLVLDRGGPPAVHEHDLVGRHEVEADGADAQAGEHDGAGGVGVEGAQGVVALGRGHGAVDAGVGVAVGLELALDDVEEGGPLAEEDRFRAGLAARGVQDGEQGLDLAAAGVEVDGGGRGRFAQVGGRLHEHGVVAQVGAAHGAFVLEFDHARDAVAAEDVRAVRDDGLVPLEVFQADRAVFAGLDAELEHILESAAVLGREVDGLLGFKHGHQGCDAFAAELPVVADLSQTEQDFEQMAVCFLCLLAVPLVGSLLIRLQQALCFRLKGVVLLLFLRMKFDTVDILGEFGEAKVDKGHLLTPSQAYSAHQRSEKQGRFLVASLQWSNENAVEYFQPLKTTSQADEFD